jgi:DnaJ-class molecular chaperone
MASSVLTRSVRRKDKEGGEPTLPCPGCGGRGRFEWCRDDELPRQWSWDAPCGMCDGRGRIPAAWLRDQSTPLR